MSTYIPNPKGTQMTCRHCGGGLWHGKDKVLLHLVDGTFKIRCEDDQHEAEVLLA